MSTEIWLAVALTALSASVVVNCSLVMWVITRESLFRFLYTSSKEWGDALMDVKNALCSLVKSADSEQRSDVQIGNELNQVSSKIDTVIHLMNRAGLPMVQVSTGDGAANQAGDDAHNHGRKHV